MWDCILPVEVINHVLFVTLLALRELIRELLLICTVIHAGSYLGRLFSQMSYD